MRSETESGNSTHEIQCTASSTVSRRCKQEAKSGMSRVVERHTPPPPSHEVKSGTSRVADRHELCEIMSGISTHKREGAVRCTALSTASRRCKQVWCRERPKSWTGMRREIKSGISTHERERAVRCTASFTASRRCKQEVRNVQRCGQA